MFALWPLGRYGDIMGTKSQDCVKKSLKSWGNIV
jgi:hypothetical protein